MGDMIRMSLRTLPLLALWVAAVGAVFAVEQGEAGRIGNVTPAALGDTRRGEVVEATPIAGFADSIVGSTTGDGGLVPEMPEAVRIDNPGDNASTLIDTGQKTLTFVGDPIVHMTTDNGIEVFARRAVADTKAKTITFTGELAIFQQGSLSRAETAVYYYDLELLKTTDVKAKLHGIILRSGQFNYETDENGNVVIVGKNASITTEDDQEPLTWLSGREIKIYAEDSILFKHLRFYYDDVPFFYFPYFYHSLNPREGYLPVIGSRSSWGAFLLNRYGILFGDRRIERGRPTADYLSTLHLDYRSRRGFGAGVDFEELALSRLSKNLTGLSLYGVYDTDPTISPVERLRPDGMDRLRWRAALQHLWELPVEGSRENQWRLKANINALGDQYVLRDFYQELFQRDPDPDNTLALTRTDPLTSLTFLQRMPINNFYMSDQRTELSFDRIRAALFNSDIVYESQSSASFMRQYVPPALRTDILRRLDNMSPYDPSRSFWERMLKTNGFFRVHTYHEFSTSHKIANFLNLTPKIGGGYTGYRDVSDLGSFDQGIFFASLDAYVKFSRKYNSLTSRTLGVNGITHVVQPYMTFAYVGANEADALMPRIDGYSASTNPIAISPGRMTEIDSMSTMAVLRYGFKNFLMTERNGGNIRWFSWDAFMDAYFHDAAEDRSFSNLYSTMQWTPLPWLSYSNVTQIPLMGDDKELRYREFNNYISFMVTRSLDVTVGHRYLAQHPILTDSSQMDVQALYRISEELAVGAAWRWEFQNGQMDIQEYNIYKNMGSWYMGIGVYMRRNGTKDEVGLGFSFTLKETGAHMPVKFY